MNGQQLKDARQKLGMSIAAAARSVGVARKTWKKWEKRGADVPARVAVSVGWMLSVRERALHYMTPPSVFQVL